MREACFYIVSFQMYLTETREMDDLPETKPTGSHNPLVDLLFFICCLNWISNATQPRREVVVLRASVDEEVAPTSMLRL